mgnify:CR=1 FL=1
MNRDFVERINQISYRTIPKTSGNIACHRYTPWWDEECTEAIRNRRQAKALLYRQPTQENLINYKRKEAIAKRIMLVKKRKSFENFVQSISNETTTKETWNKIRSIQGKKVRSVCFPVGDFADSESTKANLFGEHFTQNNLNKSDEDSIMKSNNDKIINDSKYIFDIENHVT